MSDLVEFLRARLDEDEAVAREAGGKHWQWDHGFGEMCNDPTCPYGHLKADGEVPTLLMEVHGFDVHADWQGAAHIARWDPARVLAEVAAKRRVLDICAAIADTEIGRVGVESHDLAFGVLDALAQPYADHADFDPAWLTPPAKETP